MSRRQLNHSSVASERGAAAILFAVVLPLLILMTAFVVDLGYGFYSKQRLQDALDLAAISAARALDGGSRERSNALAAANATMAQNGFAAEIITSVRFGQYSRSRPIGSRFKAEASQSGSPNAVELTANTDSPRFFSAIIGIDRLDVGATSTAMTTGRYATVKIASGLAQLKGGLLNAILGALLGGNVNLSVLDYNGLLGANIELLSFLNQYAIKVGLQAGDYDGLLNADVSVLGVLGVVADVAHNAYNGDQTALGLGIGLGDAFPGINKLPLLKLKDVSIKLGDLLGVGLGETDSGLSVPVNLFDLIMASVFAASTGTNATGQHALTVNLGTFLGASLDVSVVEPPQPPTGYRVITEQDIKNGDNLLRTAQIRLLLRVDWQGPLTGILYVVNGLLDVLQLLGLDLDLLPTYGPHANNNLSVGLSVAPAQARVTHLGCDPDDTADRYVSMSIDTGLASAHVGQIDRTAFLSNSAAAHADPFHVLGIEYNLWGLINPPIDILSVDLGVNLPIGAPTANVDVKGSDAVDKNVFPDLAALFSQSGHLPDNKDFPSGVEVGTKQIITTLGKNLRDALGLQLGGYLGNYVLQPLLTAVEYIVGDFLIGMVLGPILDAIVDLLLNILGIQVGTADVAVVDLVCGNPRLVSQ
ncbi:TadG family pilus assembly protein [Zavarzinia sp.]|uniref:TadG family pilus assembly protein n=1 Tax=Zavarzinia sp. TaxID=2027920 RepID=UPI003562D8BF